MKKLLPIGCLALALFGTTYGFAGSGQLEYIESHGGSNGQRIKTGFKPTATTRVVCDFQLTAYPGANNVTPFSWQDDNSFGCRAQVAAEGGEFISWPGASTHVPVDLKRHVIELQSGSQKFDGVEYAADGFSGSKNSNQNGMNIFCAYATWPQTSFASMRLYGMRIYNWANGFYQLVHDYVPYDRNGAIGLMDRVTGEFLANDGGGAFTAGPSIVPDIQVRDWIESHGANYLPCGMIPEDDTRIVCDYQFTELAPNGTFSPFAVLTDGLSFGVRASTRASDTGITTWVGDSAQKVGVNADLKRHVIDLANGSQKFDGKEFGTAAGGMSKATVKAGMRIFSAYAPWEQTTFATMKLFGMNIYKGDTQLRELVPCTYGGEAGLYDRIGGIFFADGMNGDFRITSSADQTELGHVHFDGSQYIDTGIVPGFNTKVVCDFQLTALDANNSISPFAWLGNNYAYGLRAKKAADGGVFMGWAGNGNDATTTVAVDLNRHVVTIGKTSLDIDGKTFSVGSVSKTAPSANGLRIGCAFAEWSQTSWVKMNLYGMKIYDGDALVRDFVPMADAVGGVGLYDRVQKVMYFPQTGRFASDMEISEREWVESSGRQYVDTECQVIKKGIKVELDFQLMKIPSEWELVAAWCSGVGGGAVGFGVNANGKFDFAFQDKNYSSFTDLEMDADLERHVVVLADGSQTLDGTPFASGTMGSPTSCGPGTLGLFARHYNWEWDAAAHKWDHMSNTRIYRCKISEGSVLKRDLRPAVACGKYVGLYDAVSGLFLPSGKPGSKYPLVARKAIRGLSIIIR